MKISHKCPKCRHNHVLYLAHVSDQVGQQGEKFDKLEKDIHRAQSMAMRIARFPVIKTSFWGEEEKPMSAGLMEAYVCRSCGYTEFYAKDPSHIPVDGEHVKEFIGPEEPDPYR